MPQCEFPLPPVLCQVLGTSDTTVLAQFAPKPSAAMWAEPAHAWPSRYPGLVSVTNTVSSTGSPGLTLHSGQDTWEPVAGRPTPLRTAHTFGHREPGGRAGATPGEGRNVASSHLPLPCDRRLQPSVKKKKKSKNK